MNFFDESTALRNWVESECWSPGHTSNLFGIFLASARRIQTHKPEASDNTGHTLYRFALNRSFARSSSAVILGVCCRKIAAALLHLPVRAPAADATYSGSTGHRRAANHVHISVFVQLGRLVGSTKHTIPPRVFKCESKREKTQ